MNNTTREPELTYEEHCKAKVGYDIAIVMDSLGSIIGAGVVSEEVGKVLEANILVLEKIIKDDK